MNVAWVALLIPIFFFGFTVWMLVDSLTHEIHDSDKRFWPVLIVVLPPLGAIIYAMKRPRLVGDKLVSSPGVTMPSQHHSNPLTSSRVIKGVGLTIAIVMGVGGLLIVGLFVVLAIALSSGGGIVGGGSSK